MNSPSGKLSGKIALVTGGNSGIGLATAKRFVAEGAFVYVTGRRRDSLAEAVRLMGETSVTAVQGDVSVLSDPDRLFAAIEADKGRLDIVFANAGAATVWNRSSTAASLKSNSLYLRVGLGDR